MAIRILIVDDEPHIRDNLQHYLSSIQGNYIVDKAASINEAMTYIKENPPDYAIIDLKLDTDSDYGGIKIYQYIKQSQPTIRSLILSAFPFEEVKEEFEKALQNVDEIENLLNEVENNYICKCGEQNYILAILEKLKPLVK